MSVIAGPTAGSVEGASTGTTILKVRADAELTQVNLGLPSDIVVYGDSISVGDKCIIDVLSSDHPTDAQVVAMARQYFLKYDQTAADPSQR